ncbi:uncharacterized protein LOC128901555 isoform X2 [Rissa tridactyla]|uniref:uncharacterized protein LOC128901555 isoform X2 n=1 Tax=Rissa tridactyla TaxID=75485 RepID=UPI0023BAFEC4|nr:uncharacterized protein LOC128901555 isoform X2 [Rissa tridactyla]
MPRGMRHGQETKFSFPFPQRLGPGELSMARRSWLAEAVGTLFWLAGLQHLPIFCKLSQGWMSNLKEMSSSRCPLLHQQIISDQPLLLSHTGAGGMEPETCSSPGDFPPPALFPNFSSAQEGDLILARGTYSCGYQRRSSLGQILLSRLSVPWVLTTKGEKDDQVKRNSTVATSPELPAEGLGVSISLAMAVLLLLALALSLHLLLQIGKRVQLARLKSFMLR